MIHLITLYFVPPEQAPAFVAFFREGGLGHTCLKEMQPGLIGTDVLQSRKSPSCFLCTEFWNSEGAYLREIHTSMRLALVRMISNLAASRIELGAFSFPDRANDGVAVPAATIAPATKVHKAESQSVHGTDELSK